MSELPATTRRGFLRAAAGTLVVSAALPLDVYGLQTDANVEMKPESGGPLGILRLRLLTRKLDELRRFYPNTLHIPVVHESGDTITVRAGGTEITFVATFTDEPYYHFAFNIPENKLPAAKEWVKARTPLVTREGRDEYHFVNWNAHSIYFNDPAGNILEFIAHHNLKNAAPGDFGPEDILYASEIGLVVDDVPATVDSSKRDLGLDVFGGSISDNFAAVGDDHRLLIVVKRDRRWFGDGRPAQVYPTTAVLQGKQPVNMSIERMPYEVSLSPV